MCRFHRRWTHSQGPVEICAPLTFDGYNFLGEADNSFKILVYGSAAEAREDEEIGSSIGFIIRRRGLYVCDHQSDKFTETVRFSGTKKIICENNNQIHFYFLQYTRSSFGHQSKTIGTCECPHAATLKIHKHINNKTKWYRFFSCKHISILWNGCSVH